MTPSALSRRIHDLEVELGVQLFERSQKRVRLSAVGRAYSEDVARVLKDIEQAGQRSRRIAKGEVGVLCIALNDTVVRHTVVSKAFHAFRSDFPDVELKLDPMSWPSLIDAPGIGNVDAAFLYTRPAESPLFDHIPIATDEFLLALPSDHPLARRSELRLADLKDEPFLWMPREPAPYVHDHLIAACQAGGLTPRIVQHLMSESARLHLVSVGMGFTFVTSSFRNYSVDKVVTRAVADLSLPLALELAWRRDNRSLILGHFLKIIQALTAAEGPSQARRVAESEFAEIALVDEPVLDHLPGFLEHLARIDHVEMGDVRAEHGLQPQSEPVVERHRSHRVVRLTAEVEVPREQPTQVVHAVNAQIRELVAVGVA